MPSKRVTSSQITWKSAEKIGSSIIVTLPKNASDKLPSRGMTVVEGTLNTVGFSVVLQPDGHGSHWFKLTRTLQKVAKVIAGDTVTLKIRPTEIWPEPKLPSDLKTALAADRQAQARWLDITPMARWEWLNWLGSVKLDKTRSERPAKLCSMLKAGKRRPCCFNRSLRMPPKCAKLL